MSYNIAQCVEIKVVMIPGSFEEDLLINTYQLKWPQLIRTKSPMSWLVMGSQASIANLVATLARYARGLRFQLLLRNFHTTFCDRICQDYFLDDDIPKIILKSHL